MFNINRIGIYLVVPYIYSDTHKHEEKFLAVPNPCVVPSLKQTKDPFLSWSPERGFHIVCQKLMGIGLVCWVLWHINLSRLFYTKSIFM